uniref:Uncharacterized protein n=1 Tax=Chenopodium quinoa TaxID=63459 RepID=A0A803LF33_CHEQI
MDLPNLLPEEEPLPAEPAMSEQQGPTEIKRKEEEVRILKSLFPPYLLELYRMLITPIGGGRLAAMMVARVTILTCQWLMGPCSINTIELRDGSSCQSGFKFGVTPPQLENDSALQEPCLDGCPYADPARGGSKAFDFLSPIIGKQFLIVGIGIDSSMKILTGNTLYDFTVVQNDTAAPCAGEEDIFQIEFRNSRFRKQLGQIWRRTSISSSIDYREEVVIGEVRFV